MCVFFSHFNVVLGVVFLTLKLVVIYIFLYIHMHVVGDVLKKWVWYKGEGCMVIM